MSYSTKETQQPAMQFYVRDWLADQGLMTCSLAAQGLWMRFLCIMHDSNPRGTLKLNGKQISSKHLSKTTSTEEATVKQIMNELEEAGVYSRLEDGTIICRRMYWKAKRLEEMASARAEAGRKGGLARAAKQAASKKQANQATSSSSLSSSSSSTSVGTPLPPKGESVSISGKRKRKSKREIKYTTWFEKFWSAYPRTERVNKIDAFDAWNTRLSEVKGDKGRATEVDRMILGATNYAKQCHDQGTEERYIRHPAAFLGPSRHYEAYQEYTSPQDEDKERKQAELETHIEKLKTGKADSRLIEIAEQRLAKMKERIGGEN